MWKAPTGYGMRLILRKGRGELSLEARERKESQARQSTKTTLFRLISTRILGYLASVMALIRPLNSSTLSRNHRRPRPLHSKGDQRGKVCLLHFVTNINHKSTENQPRTKTPLQPCLLTTQHPRWKGQIPRSPSSLLDLTFDARFQ